MCRPPRRTSEWKHPGVGDGRPVVGALLLALLITSCSAPAFPGGSEEQSGGGAGSASVPAFGSVASLDEGSGIDAADAESSGSDEDDGIALHGSISSRLRTRRGDGEYEVDFSSLVSLEVGDPEVNDYTAYLLGRVLKEFGGTSDPDDPFFGLNDTDSSSWDSRLYEGYIDFHRIEGLDSLRLGRQSMYDTPEFVTFDGATAITDPIGEHDLELAAYLGRPHNTYDASHNGDWIGGGWAEARPWARARARLDYQHIDADITDENEEYNDLFALSLWQTVNEKLRVRGSFSKLDGESRDLELAGTYYEPETDLGVRVRYKELLSTQRQLVNALDPLFETLREYKPYWEMQTLVTKGFGPQWFLEGGASLRRLSDGGDESEFNHEFDRYHVTGSADDVFAEDVTVSLTGEVWDADQGDHYATWGFDVTREYTEQVRLSGGMAYAKWKDDYLLDDEEEDVTTWYGRLRYKVDDQTTWTFRYDLDDSDLGTYHNLIARLSWRF